MCGKIGEGGAEAYLASTSINVICAAPVAAAVAAAATSVLSLRACHSMRSQYAGTRPLSLVSYKSVQRSYLYVGRKSMGAS